MRKDEGEYLLGCPEFRPLNWPKKPVTVIVSIFKDAILHMTMTADLPIWICLTLKYPS